MKKVERINFGENLYIGEIVNGKRQGKGEYICMNGEHKHYKGDWINDQKHGQGATIHKNGHIYIGGYFEGLRNGAGLKIQKNGHRYQGNYEKGSMSGTAVIYHLNQDIYEGEVKDSLKQGKGKYYFKNGTLFEGNFEANNFSIGTYYFFDEDKREILFLGNNGYKLVKHFYANGDIYQGQFSNNSKHGKGIQFWRLGRKYVGEFQHGHISGEGKIIELTGQSFRGNFIMGKLHGVIFHRITNDEVYIEKYQQGELLQSNLTYPPYLEKKTFQNGYYQGEISSDQIREGSGDFIYDQNRRISINWKDNQMHGKGSLVIKNHTFQAIYQHGVCIQLNLRKLTPLNATSYLINLEDCEYQPWSEHVIDEQKTIYLRKDKSCEENEPEDSKEGSRYGIICYSNSDIYEGFIKNNIKDGKGVFTTNDGLIFTGQFLKDQMQGFITIQDHQANIKDVLCRDNIIIEYLAYEYSKHSIYQRYSGKLVHELFEGEGVLKFKNGDVYEGMFKKGERVHNGLMIYAEGGKYEGGFKKNSFEKEGRGRLCLENGDVFEGQFKDNQMHGKIYHSVRGRPEVYNEEYAEGSLLKCVQVKKGRAK